MLCSDDAVRSPGRRRIPPSRVDAGTRAGAPQSNEASLFEQLITPQLRQRNLIAHRSPQPARQLGAGCQAAGGADAAQRSATTSRASRHRPITSPRTVRRRPGCRRGELRSEM
jgi:hypothetical protein